LQYYGKITCNFLQKVLAKNKGSDGLESLLMFFSKDSSTCQHLINYFQVPFQIAQLLFNGFSDLFSGSFSAAGKFQIVFVGSFAVGARPFTLCRVMHFIYHFFCVFTGFIEQFCVLRILYLRGSTGGIDN